MIFKCDCLGRWHAAFRVRIGIAHCWKFQLMGRNMPKKALFYRRFTIKWAEIRIFYCNCTPLPAKVSSTVLNRAGSDWRREYCRYTWFGVFINNWSHWKNWQRNWLWCFTNGRLLKISITSVVAISTCPRISRMYIRLNPAWQGCIAFGWRKCGEIVKSGNSEDTSLARFSYFLRIYNMSLRVYAAWCRFINNGRSHPLQTQCNRSPSTILSEFVKIVV